MKKTKLLKMSDGTIVALNEKQALWMGKSKPKHAGCDGCIVFGECVFHSSWGKEVADG